MTKTERLLAATGIAVLASAVLLNAYVQASIPADAAAAGCTEERSKFGQDLDQIRFSVSASHAVSIAVDYSSQSRENYARAIAATKREISGAHVAPGEARVILDQLARASQIVNDETAPLHQAQAILAQVRREVASAGPLIDEASRDVAARDCSALSLTMERSGWPRERTLKELSLAARINSQASGKLESALELLLSAQRAARNAAANLGRLM